MTRKLFINRDHHFYTTILLFGPIALTTLLLSACATPAPATTGPPASQVPVSTRIPTIPPPSTSGPRPSPTPTSTAQSNQTPSSSSDAIATPVTRAAYQYSQQEFQLPYYAHDVAPAEDGTVWWTAQGNGELGRFDPSTGKSQQFPLGAGSAPHGVIIGPDGAAWVTDGGLNAIVRVDNISGAVRVFPLPSNWPNVNLNTAVFANGILWFTGQNGIYGRLDPSNGSMQVFDAPRGHGPYGITVTPGGQVFYASLAGNHIAQIDTNTGTATLIEPPTPNQGARRVWSDSKGVIWVSEWNVGQVGRYDPSTGGWQEWKLPGARPQAYAVFVDNRDQVWLSQWGTNSIVRFDPATESFESFSLSANANVRQILGRGGDIWAAESGNNKLVLIRRLP